MIAKTTIETVHRVGRDDHGSRAAAARKTACDILPAVASSSVPYTTSDDRQAGQQSRATRLNESRPRSQAEITKSVLIAAAAT